MKFLLITFFACCLFFSSNAQTVLLNEKFDNGIPAAWSINNADGLTPHSQVAFVNNAWVGFINSFDTCAVSTSYYIVDSNQVSQASDYLITPKLSLLSFGSLLTWSSKSFDANYTEDYYVLLSTSGNNIADFTDTLKKVTNDAPNWKSFSLNLFSLGYSNQDVYIAFKNVSTDKYLLGIDNVKVTTNDPASIKNSAGLKINVFPNPVVNTLKIESNESISFKLINLAGQTILTGTQKTIDFSQFNKGIYFLTIKKGDTSVTHKIVKI